MIMGARPAAWGARHDQRTAEMAGAEEMRDEDGDAFH
jgi:hypothetical protein